MSKILTALKNAANKERLTGLLSTVWAVRRIQLWFELKEATAKAEWQKVKAETLEKIDMKDDESNWAKHRLIIEIAAKLGHEFTILKGNKAVAPFAVSCSHLCITIIGKKFVQNPNQNHFDDLESIWHDVNQVKLTKLVDRWIAAGGQASWLREELAKTKKSGTSQTVKAPIGVEDDRATAATIDDSQVADSEQTPKDRQMTAFAALDGIDEHIADATTSMAMKKLLLTRMAGTVKKLMEATSEEVCQG
tara:strand:+ start:344 stop:1090 length:747 start_codon:yes stop_codon:yes gene_type:complete